MARALSQFLKVTNGNTVVKRWQSYYIGQAVSWASFSWGYFPFFTDGLVSGQVGSDRLTITMPATSEAAELVNAALKDAYLVEVSMFEFDTYLGNDEPQDDQQLVMSYLGEITGATATLTELTVELGSSLAPIGAQVPPRKFTNSLIGNPCRL